MASQMQSLSDFLSKEVHQSHANGHARSGRRQSRASRPDTAPTEPPPHYTTAEARAANDASPSPRSAGAWRGSARKAARCTASASPCRRSAVSAPARSRNRASPSGGGAPSALLAPATAWRAVRRDGGPRLSRGCSAATSRRSS